jgi:hypothetical protein
MTNGRYRHRELGAALALQETALAGDMVVMAEPNGPSASKQVDAALAREEYSAALRAANEVYALALSTTHWDRMVRAGDLYRRIGEVTGLRETFEAKARGAYGTTFFRARLGHPSFIAGAARHLKAVDRALGGQNDVDRPERAWEKAHLTAMNGSARAGAPAMGRRLACSPRRA